VTYVDVMRGGGSGRPGRLIENWKLQIGNCKLPDEERVWVCDSWGSEGSVGISDRAYEGVSHEHRDELRGSEDELTALCFGFVISAVVVLCKYYFTVLK